jgi:hypothetical protein
LDDLADQFGGLLNAHLCGGTGRRTIEAPCKRLRIEPLNRLACHLRRLVHRMAKITLHIVDALT